MKDHWHMGAWRVRRTSIWFWSLLLCFSGTADMLFRPAAPQFDFKTLYCAAAVAREGGDYYDLTTLHAMAAHHGLPQPVWPYLYPPFLAEFAAPLTFWPYQACEKGWMIVHIFAGAFIVASGVKLSRRRDAAKAATPITVHPLHLAAVAGLFHLLAFRHNLFMGQINVLVLLAISASLVACAAKRDALSGMALSLAIVIKMSPAILLLYYAVSRRPRILVACLLCAVVLLLMTLPLSGLQKWLHFGQLLPQLAPGETVAGLFPPDSLYNFSLAGFLSRLISSHTLVRGLAAAFAAMLLIASYRCARPHLRQAPEYLLLPLLTLMIIASPLSYIHHIIYLFPGICWLAGHTDSASKRALILCGLLIGAAAVAAVDFPSRYPWYLTRHALNGWKAILFTSLNLYALLLVLLFSCLLTRMPSQTLPENAHKSADSCTH